MAHIENKSGGQPPVQPRHELVEKSGSADVVHALLTGGGLGGAGVAARTVVNQIGQTMRNTRNQQEQTRRVELQQQGLTDRTRIKAGGETSTSSQPPTTP